MPQERNLELSGYTDKFIRTAARLHSNGKTRV